MTEEVKKCCGANLTRTYKGIGHIIERYECAKCGDTYQPFLTEAVNGIKIDAKVADCLKGQVTWMREES